MYICVTNNKNMENFQPTHFNNGDPIPVAKSIEEFNVTFSDVKTPFRIEYNGTTYYNKYAVQDKRGLVPAGYRFPCADDAFDIPRRGYIMESTLNTGRALGGCWLQHNKKIGAFKNVDSAQALIIDFYNSIEAMSMPFAWGFELYFVKL